MSAPTLSLVNASIAPLWHDVTLHAAPGEFIAVLGPNGVGKSTLLRAMLGQQRLTSGTCTVTGRIGLIPQQRMFDTELPLRARDLVSLACAHGMVSRRRPRTSEVERLLTAVGAAHCANQRVGLLSGGQQQLVRQAQALACDPQLLLCDEPLLSLDYKAAAETVRRLDDRRQKCNTTIIFVTHSINPIIDVTDRILYLAPHGHVIGTTNEVLQSDVLSELYKTHVTVARIDGRVVVI